MLEGPVRASCGFLLAQRQDFGSPDKVNGLFHDLLRVTPFSKEEVAEFNDVLKKRNLLVHHGGIYTTAFLRDKPRDRRERIFTDSFQLSRPDVFRLGALVNEIALATARRTQTILRERFPEEGLTKFQSEGIDLLDLGHGDCEGRSARLRGYAVDWPYPNPIP
jgi:hypothetical protein